MIFGSARSAGVMARMMAAPVHVPVVDLGQRLLHLPGAGQHAQDPADRAHLADRQHLLQEVLEGELAGHLGGRLGLVGLEGLLGLLDQGEHVAHAQDPGGHPVGVEDVEVGELLAGGREHDRLAGDVADRQRGATAGVAVELGEHHAGEPDAVAERLGGGHRVLADHRVDDEQDLVGLDGVPDVGGLPHHLGVDAEPAGGVDDDDVVASRRACATPRRATATGSPTPLPGSGREDRHARPARRRSAAG